MLPGKAYSKLSKSDKLFLSEYVNSILEQYNRINRDKFSEAISFPINPATFPFLPADALQAILHFSYAGGIRDTDYRFIRLMWVLFPKGEHYQVSRKKSGFGFRKKGKVRVK